MTATPPLDTRQQSKRWNGSATQREDWCSSIVIGVRIWASSNPLAQMRTPMTIEEHQSSRWVAEPFHLFDCCLVSNGGVAVIVTSAERAAALRQPPVYVLGWGQ